MPIRLREPLNASLVQTCAPWDGPAVALFLTEEPSATAYPPPPYSGLTVYRSVTEALGHRFNVGPATQSIGNAQICPATGECQPVRAASVTFRGLAADSTVALTYRLELTSGRVITGQARPASSTNGNVRLALGDPGMRILRYLFRTPTCRSLSDPSPRSRL